MAPPQFGKRPKHSHLDGVSVVFAAGQDIVAASMVVKATIEDGCMVMMVVLRLWRLVIAGFEENFIFRYSSRVSDTTTLIVVCQTLL